MLKLRVLIIGLVLFLVAGIVTALKARSYNYVWIGDPLYPEKGCFIKVNYYTLDPNGTSVMITYASIVNTVSCEMKVLYTGEGFIQ
ncbi:hypothetical protein ACTJJB_12870 [Chitinophaga sp. 22536]|uniref:hypothetical protein n=1 Tax=unclassified Chitinophaga TaxID=2619133 RepID=UPI003F8386DC